MTKMHVARDMNSLLKVLEKESKNWLAIVDSIGDVSIPKKWKGRVFLSSDIEKLMFQGTGDGSSRVLDPELVHRFKRHFFMDLVNPKKMGKYVGGELRN